MSRQKRKIPITEGKKSSQLIERSRASREKKKETSIDLGGTFVSAKNRKSQAGGETFKFHCLRMLGVV